MYLLTGLTDKPKQTFSVTLADGSQADFYMEYRERQKGWFFDLIYGAFAVKGQRLTLHPNVLRQFRNLIPFGLAVSSDRPYEPQDLSALSDGTVFLYLFEGDELDAIDALIDE